MINITSLSLVEVEVELEVSVYMKCEVCELRLRKMKQIYYILGTVVICCLSHHYDAKSSINVCLRNHWSCYQGNLAVRRYPTKEV